jgi:predicted lipid-binding transport protein (Tim44 family)
MCHHGCVVNVVNKELDRHDEHATEPAVPAHDPHAEPSAAWGWHGGFPRAARIGGWILAAIMFLMLIGNHQGRVEDLWLIATGLVIIGFLVADQIKRRTSWRR